MLKITGDGRKAALDMRLVDAFADAQATRSSAAPSSESARSGTRLATSARPNSSSATFRRRDPERFNVYDEVRSRLIAGGIPEREIAFIHDADSDAAKMMLFDAVNAGRVRILHRLDRKDGSGHERAAPPRALHHLDAPWRPRDIEQREGRILRQGNLNAEVEIYRYVTEGSFDAYMWQTLETKARFIQQVMSGQTSRCAPPRISKAARSPTPKSRPSPPAIRP